MAEDKKQALKEVKDKAKAIAKAIAKVPAQQTCDHAKKDAIQILNHWLIH